MTGEVDISRLSVSDELGKGGFATISRLQGHTISSETGPFVLKRYRPQVVIAHPGIRFSLEGLVRVRNEMSSDDRAKLDKRTVWPLQVATDQGKVVGLIMHELPEKFFHDMPLVRGGTKRVAREMQMYFCSPDRSSRNGLSELDFNVRLMALAHFASQLNFLHSKGIIVGDIQGSNTVIYPGKNQVTGVRICMVDSDSYRTTRSRPAVAQPHAMSWDPPEISALHKRANALPPGHDKDALRAQAAVQTTRSDVYKFGLFVIRFLAMVNGVATSKDPAIAKDRMIRTIGAKRTGVLLQALDPNPHSRPDMAAIRPALVGA